MDDKELIINTAKEILITALEYEDIISPDEEVKPDEVVNQIGEAFKTLTQKVSEALKSIKEWYCMTKVDIAKELYERNYKWLSRNEASDMVELLIDTLKENLAEGETVKISGFGTLIG